MKLKLFCILFAFGLGSFAPGSYSFGQGTVRGKITDENGEAAINAIVFIKSQPSVKTAADFDGNYSLKISDSTAQTLVITFMGHDTIKEVVRVLKGEVVIKNFSLKLYGANIKPDFVVEAKRVKAKDNYMEQFKLNSSVTVDYISAETMKRTGDPNVATAMTRIPGVSSNSGGLITVRGIGDRYVKTTVNGSRIPTLDPFTNNIKLDMFPASLVDNIIITKTASPDLPGDWAGAYLSVETKDYPEKFSVNVESSFGYNNHTSFKDILTSEHNSKGVFGYNKEDHGNYVPAIPQPSQYQEMIALGLGSYYSSLGVTSTSWNSTFFNMGLVKLGLLESSQLDDQAAIAAAINTYNSVYKIQAFDVLNNNASSFGKSLPNNWDVSRRNAPVNFTQGFSIGNQVNLFKRQLGFLVGFRYGGSFKYDSSSTAARIFVHPDVDTVEVITEGMQQSSVETNNWSALVNLAYKLSSNHSVSFLFMPNLTDVNSARSGYNSNASNDASILIIKTQFYEQRKQMIYQFKSEHYFPKPQLKIEFNTSYTFGKSNAPDFKNLLYVKHNSGVHSIGGGEYPVQRFYRYLSENLFDSRLSAERPFRSKPGLSRKLKFGGAYQQMDKKTDQYEYYLNTANYSKPFDGNVTPYLDTSNFSILSGDNAGIPFHEIELYYQGSERFWDHNMGYSRIAAGFAMMDYSFTNLLRVSGGLRIEQANIYTDVLKYDTLDYAPEDPRRNFKPGVLDTLNYLPSVNVIYKLKDNEEAPINLRFNYSRTTARPSIRELSGYFAYDYQLRSYVVGNFNLRAAGINNFDLRFESYFKSRDNISVSLFYKNFINHIELLNTGPAYTWQNIDDSYVTGIELEGKLNLFKNLELRANVTLVRSHSSYDQYAITITDDGEFEQGAKQAHISRTMFGQAPYVINGIVSYRIDTVKHKAVRLAASVSYNIQGPKLIIPGLFITPDVYELSRHLLDMKISKEIGKHFSASITVRDVFNSPERRSYRNENEWVRDYDKYRYGTNYILSIAYKLQ